MVETPSLTNVRVETGVDVTAISRVRRLLEDTAFRDRAFAQTEVVYCEETRRPAEHYAARWCVKEALRKLVANPGAVAFGDVVTERDSDGPQLSVSGTAVRALTETFGVEPSADRVDTAVSLTHDRESDTATAIVTVAVGGEP